MGGELYGGEKCYTDRSFTEGPSHAKPASLGNLGQFIEFALVTKCKQWEEPLKVRVNSGFKIWMERP
jgi:hypothetical protein